MLMHKRCHIPLLTTREAVSKATPWKHETSYGVQYTNLCNLGPDAKYNTQHMLAEEADDGSATTESFRSLYYQHTVSQFFPS